MKIVVFDLDETLGYFTQLGILWDSLKEYSLQNDEILTQYNFNSILDNCQEFLRPDIIEILSYLKKKKKSKSCNKIMIYTNNTGNRDWCEKIINYFHFKLNYKLFDQIIAAFKINGNIIELCRTTNEKTHNDLLKCTKIPYNSEICFLDDKYHSKMNTKQIYYIQLKPYYYEIAWNNLLSRINNFNLPDCFLEKNRLLELSDIIDKYNFFPREKNEKDIIIDKDISIDIYKHLVIFFNNRKTKKNKNNSNNKTNRIY